MDGTMLPRYGARVEPWETRLQLLRQENDGGLASAVFIVDLYYNL